MNSNKRIKFSFIMALLAFMLPIQNEAATIQKGCFGTITLYVDEEKTVSSSFESFAESMADNVRWSSTEEFWISDTNYRNNNYFYTIKSENIYSHTCVLVGRLPTTEPQKVYCHLNYKGTRYIGYYNVEVISLGKLSVEQRKEGNVVYLSCPLVPNANLYYFIGDYDFLWTDRYDGWIDVDYYDYNTHTVKNAIPYTSSGITLPSGEKEVLITGFASYPKYEVGYYSFIWINKILVSNIVLSSSSVSLEIGKSENLQATVLPDNATNKSVTWSSSNSSVASVSSSGMVTAKAKGTAIITCKANDGSGISSTCKVTVIEPKTNGDVNGDGEVTGTDLVAMTNMILGKTEKKASADLNGDGDVSGTDYVMLVNIVLGKKQ